MWYVICSDDDWYNTHYYSHTSVKDIFMIYTTLYRGVTELYLDRKLSSYFLYNVYTTD